MSAEKEAREEKEAVVASAKKKKQAKTKDGRASSADKALEAAAKRKEMPHAAEALYSNMIDDPEVLRKQQKEAARITASKCVGTYEKVPYEILDEHQKGNVLRDLNPKFVEEKVEAIGEEWNDYTLIVGCVDERSWKRDMKDWLEGERDLKDMPEDKVETLDGQHRREAAKKLQETGKVPQPKILLQLYVNLEKEEKVAITNNLLYMQTQQEKMTLTNLLRMLRERWVTLVFDKKEDPAEADVKIITEFHNQITELTGSVKVEEAKKLAAAQKTNGNEATKVVAKYVETYHYKIKWAYQVPPFTSKFSVWPAWYDHLCKMQEEGKPYSVESLTGLQGFASSVERYSAMLFAASKGSSMEGPAFKVFCKIIKNRASVKEWFKDKVVARWLKIQRANQKLATAESLTRQKQKWHALFSAPCSPTDLLVLVNEKDKDHLADAIMTDILFSSKEKANLLDWTHLWTLHEEQTFEEILTQIKEDMPTQVDTTLESKVSRNESSGPKFTNFFNVIQRSDTSSWSTAGKETSKPK